MEHHMSTRTRTFEVLAGDRRWKVIGYENGEVKLEQTYLHEEDALEAAYDWMNDHEYLIDEA